ncbi:MAG TPA: efflux RND transporter permease subunit, partial [bacterium]|nr:efflux RND transporter permease subunit [bacterium]
GVSLGDAVTQAGDQRLRPILMTALTTILGLLPMAMAFGPGQEIRQPLAVTIILGMLVSTFMTLLVIPTIYYLIHRRSAIRSGAGAGEDRIGY